MCDYSLHSIKSRPAKIGDKLSTCDFGTGTRGFAAPEDPNVAVCVLPGTELAFAHEVNRLPLRLWPRRSAIGHKTAIFRQINKDRMAAHHDALEFPDGEIVLLTLLAEAQEATVLQLPAEPKTAAAVAAQTRTAVATSWEDMVTQMDEMEIHDYLLEARGAMAVVEAAQKACSCEDRGQTEEAETWRHIEAVLKQMRGPHVS
jgi:hypothetical protein